MNQQITDACHFLEDVDEAIRKHGPENVYNLDEKPVSGAPSSVSSFQIMGEQTENIHSIGSPYRIMTAVVNTAASGRKLFILFLKKGELKTCASFKAFKNNVTLYSNELDLTPKGWMNEPTMLMYLDMFIANIPHRPCTLILDHYGSHWTAPVLQRAKELQIDIILVPKTMTDELQPLDVGVFGCLQGMTDADWENEESEIDYMNRFQRSYQELSASIIQKAFAKALDIPLDAMQVSNPSPAAQALNSIDSSFQYAMRDLQQRGSL